MKTWLALAVLTAALLSPPVSAQGAGRLADSLPDDTLVYLEIPNVAEARRNLDEGAFGQVLREPGFEALRELVRGLLEGPISDADRGTFDLLGADLEDALSLLQGEVALAFLGVDEASEEPLFALAIDAGKNAALLAKVAGTVGAKFEAAKQEGRELPPVVALLRAENQRLVGSRLVVSNVPAVRDGKPARALSRSDVFRRCSTRVAPGRHDLFVHVALPALLDRFVSGQDPRTDRALAALGAGGIETISAALDFGGDASTSRLFLGTRGERTGLVRILSLPPVKTDLVDQVPAEAFDTTAGSLDLPGWWDAVQAILEGIDPETSKRVADAVARVHEESRVDLDAFLRRFGPAFVSYGAEAPLGGYLADTYLVTTVDDPVRFVDEARRLLEATRYVRLASFECGGKTIHAIETAPPIEDEGPGERSLVAGLVGGASFVGLPGAFYLDGKLLVAANSGQAIQRRLLAGAITPRTDLAADGASGLLFRVDQKRSIGGTYNGLVQMARFGFQMAQAQGAIPPDATFHPDQLPPAESFARHLPEGRFRLVSYEEGILFESESLLLPSGSVSAPTLGIMSAMLLPALAAVKESANRKRCTANLKQIGLGLVLYQQKHDEFLPPFGPKFLDTIYEEGILLDPQVYVCPSGADPLTERGGPLSTSYESWSGGKLTSGLIARFGSRTPLAWDRSVDNHSDVRNVLFADGHVEEMSEAMFEDTLDRMAAQLELKR